MTARAEGADADSSPRPLPPLQRCLAALALGGFVGSILAAALLYLATAWLLLAAPRSPWGWTLAALTVALSYAPLRWRAFGLGSAYITYCCTSAPRYFPVRVVCDDGAAFSPERPYIIGLEPHSALPCALPAAFGLQGNVLPEGLRHRTHGLASSICFSIPFVRHLYHWIGIRPITRGCMRRLLHHNKCVVLVPGGVQECLFMQKDSETAFLRKRKGFVRMAMQNSSPLVPCFAFGQSKTYNWYRLGPPLVLDATVQALSRRLGMVPMLLVGRAGTPVPIAAPMTVVFGKPIEVPHLDSPPDDVLQEYLDRFIAAMEELFDKHKAAAGYAGWKLRVL